MMLCLFVLVVICAGTTYGALRIELGGLHAAFRRPAASGFTGFQVARFVLDQAGLTHVRIRVMTAPLSDHFDPRARVVVLSTGVANGRNLGAAAAACHEACHAIQHSRDFGFSLWLLARVGHQVAGLFVLPLVVVALLFNSTALGIIATAIWLASLKCGIATAIHEEMTSAEALRRLEAEGVLRGDTELDLARKALSCFSKTYWLSSFAHPWFALLDLFNNERNDMAAYEGDTWGSAPKGQPDSPTINQSTTWSAAGLPTAEIPQSAGSLSSSQVPGFGQPVTNIVSGHGISATTVVVLILAGLVVFLLLRPSESMGEQASHLASALRGASGR